MEEVVAAAAAMAAAGGAQSGPGGGGARLCAVRRSLWSDYHSGIIWESWLL